VINDSVFNDNGAFGEYLYFEYDTDAGGYTESEYGSGITIESSGNTLLNQNTASGNYADGANITASNIDVICGSYADNGGYGINALSGTSLTLMDVFFAPANGSGDYSYPGAASSSSGDCYPVQDVAGKEVQQNFIDNQLPWNVVHVESTPDQNVELDCSSYRGTILVLPNNDRVIYPCGLKDAGNIQTKTIDEIPALPADSTFLSSCFVQLFQDNRQKLQAEPAITVSFIIPEGTNVDDLAILYWNGSKWVRLENTYDQYTDELHYFEGASSFTGMFALISW